MSKPPSKRSVAAKTNVMSMLDGDPDVEKLQAALTTLAKWRADLLRNTVTAQDGVTIQSGPFQGMRYASQTPNQPHVPRLLGTHDAALHPTLEAIIAEAPPLVIDVGCGDGFFAIGLALRLPRSTIWARDTDEAARTATEALASANEVARRVKIGGALTHADFDICRAQSTLILCSLNKATDALLDPDRAKGLRRADLLIALPTSQHPQMHDTLATRFGDTHVTSIILRTDVPTSQPNWMLGLSDLDRAIAHCEWHDGPTSWAWLRRKNRD